MRKGQFYMIDAFFAAAILFVGIGFVVTSYVSVPQQRQTQLISQDLVTLLTQTRIGDLQNSYVRANYPILDEDLSPMQQVHRWWYNDTVVNPGGCPSCLTNATALISALVNDVVGPQYGVEVILDNQTPFIVYSRPLQRTPAAMIVKRAVLLTQWNQTTIIGPATMEVRVWR